MDISRSRKNIRICNSEFKEYLRKKKRYYKYSFQNGSYNSKKRIAELKVYYLY
ncbi:MAG: hypothetical protein ACLRY8_04360 [Clostridium butyricum]